MATHEITLDVTKKEITPQVIHTRVGDSNVTIKATVTNDGAAYSLSGATVKFKAAKPDGTYAEQSATVSGSTATVTLAPEFLAVPGIIKTAYFEITASGKKDTTGNVWIDNRADAEGEAPDLSTSYIPTVDQLVEDATEALNSANTALGNAEEALEDAEAATDSATDAAASANAAASAAQSAIDAMTGNVLRGTVGPSEVVGVEDAYPQVPLGVKVKGVTRQNLWVNPSGTSLGVTSVENDDGSVTVSGTNNGTSGSWLYSPNRVYTLKAGQTYTASIDKKIGNDTTACFIVESRDASDVSTILAYVYNSPVTFTVPDNMAYIRCVFYAANGKTASGTYRVMLNEGSEAEPWCPPGLNSVEGLEIWSAGKNLWINPTGTKNGITSTENDDGSLTVSGAFQDGSSGFQSKRLYVLKPSTTYVLSVDKAVPGATIGVFYLTEYTADASYLKQTKVGLAGVLEASFTTAANLGFCTCELSSAVGDTLSGTYRVMLNEGSAAEPWEKPHYASTTVNLSSNALRSLPDGTCDVLTIGEDGTASIERAVYQQTLDEDTGIGGTWNGTGASDAVFDAYMVIGKAARDYSTKQQIRCDGLPGGESLNGRSVYTTKTARATLRLLKTDLASLNNAGIESWLADHPLEIAYAMATPDAVSLPAVTLPSLPGPTANVWAVATDGHGNTFTLQPEIELEYARDVTQVIGSLEAKVAALELLHETE